MWKTILNGVYSQYTQFTVLFHICTFCFMLGGKTPISQLDEQKWDTEKPKLRFCYTTFLRHATFHHSANTIPSMEVTAKVNPVAQETEGMIPFFLNLLWNYELTPLQKAEPVSEWRVAKNHSGVLVGQEELWKHPEPCPASASAVKTSPRARPAGPPPAQSRLRPAPFPLPRWEHPWGVWPFRSVSTFRSVYKFPKLT